MPKRSALFEVKAQKRKVTASDLLVTLLIVKTPLVQFASVAIDGARRITDKNGTATWVSNGSVGSTTALVLAALIGLTSVHIGFARSTVGARIHPPLSVQIFGFLGLVLLVALAFRAEVNMSTYPTILGIIVVLAVSFGNPPQINRQTIGWSGATVLASLIIYQVIQYSNSTSGCRIDKCSPFGGLWHSYFPQENNLGLTVALLVPTIAFLPAQRLRALAILSTGLMVLGTGSRTAQVMCAVGLVCYVAIRKNAQVQASHGSAINYAKWIPALAVLASVVVVLESGLNLFTNRGSIYGILLKGLQEHPVLGPGRSILKRAFENRETGRYLVVHEHGQIPYLMTNAGLFGVVLFVLACALWIQARPNSTLAVALFATAAAGFVTEPIWEISISTAYFWSFIVCIILIRERNTHHEDAKLDLYV